MEPTIAQGMALATDPRGNLRKFRGVSPQHRRAIYERVRAQVASFEAARDGRPEGALPLVQPANRSGTTAQSVASETMGSGAQAALMDDSPTAGHQMDTAFDRFLNSDTRGLDSLTPEQRGSPDFTKINPALWWLNIGRGTFGGPMFFTAMANQGAKEITDEPERDFSLAGLNLSPLASKLDHRLLEMRIFIKRNKKFRPNALQPDPRCFEFKRAGGSAAGGSAAGGGKGKQEAELKYKPALGVPILKRDEAKKLLPGWAPTDKLADA